MTDAELKAIEDRWNSKYMCVSDEALKEINRLLAEVRRLNRMVDSACNLLIMDSMFSADAWRKYLESEVADKCSMKSVAE